VIRKTLKSTKCYFTYTAIEDDDEEPFREQGSLVRYFKKHAGMSMIDFDLT
jgi:hypothetical protein